MNLVYECCADMGVVDRLSDLMQRKLREFQAAQVVRIPTHTPLAPVHSIGSPPRATRKSDFGTSDDGFICGSSAFQDVAAYSSSYKGLVSLFNLHLLVQVICANSGVSGIPWKLSPRAGVRSRGSQVAGSARHFWRSEAASTEGREPFPYSKVAGN